MFQLEVGILGSSNTAQLHDAAGAVGDHDAGTGGFAVFDLLATHFGSEFGELDGEGTTEAAAGVFFLSGGIGGGHLQKGARFFHNVVVTHMTGSMVAHLVVGRLEVFGLEVEVLVDEVGEVHHLGGEDLGAIFIFGTGEQLGIAVLQVTGAGSAEGDDGMILAGIKALHEAIRIAEKHDAFDRIIFASFHSEIFAESMRMKKEGEVPEQIMLSPSLGSTIKFFGLHFFGLDVFYFDSIAVLQVPMEEYGFTIATKSFVKSAHKHNLAVQFWTINDIEEMKTLIDIGADGIMTDYPHRLQEVYNSYSK